MDRRSLPVGIMDSGLGGISVMREIVKLMPGEHYIYYGDSANAPYGIKPTAEIRRLTEQAVQALLEKQAKAIVIACNTATSAAAAYLREKYTDIPIIGIEPAIKPAVLTHKGEKILVMATPLTLAEKKFHALEAQYGRQADIIELPCEGLMEYVEQGITEGPELDAYLQKKLGPYRDVPFGAVVLGCTHYPFVKKAIAAALGRQTEFVDGSAGTARQLRRRLQQENLCNPSEEEGSVEIMNSTGDVNLMMQAFALLDMQ